MPVKYSAAYETEGEEAKVWITYVPTGVEQAPAFGSSIVDKTMAEGVTLPDVVKEVLRNGGFYRDNAFIPYHSIRSINEVKE